MPGEATAVKPQRASDDWATPKWLLALMFPEGYYYDPCPLGGSGGLEAEWPTVATVYINPPFSNPLPWVRRAAEHPGPVVLLLPVDPTTRWWTYSEGFEVTLIGSRLHFNESATYARQTLCVWRKGMPQSGLTALRARVARLEGALEKYGQHGVSCAVHDADDCTCGLSAAMAGEPRKEGENG